ncbi:hypothetical protein MUO56_02210, partial [Candidatus Bathyarchaeota archaeon]|nr:hypothetical protein [Candidatus Bathyarchaeota archaeon]
DSPQERDTRLALLQSKTELRNAHTRYKHRPRDAEELKVVGNDKPKSTKPRESDCILSSVLLAFSYIVNLRVRLEPFEET